MVFSRQECWRGLPYLPLGDLPNPGIKPVSLTSLHWQPGSLPLALLWERYTDIQFGPYRKDRVYVVISNWCTQLPQRMGTNLFLRGHSKEQNGFEPVASWAGVVHTHSVSSFMALYMLSREWEWASLVTQTVKTLPATQGTGVRSLGREDPLEKGVAIHSSVLAWRIPRTEEPGGAQSMGWQKDGHD